MTKQNKTDKKNEIKREIDQKNFVELPNGEKRFAKGNQIGRMRRHGYTLDDLTKAMMEYEKDNGFSFLEHYLERVGKNDRLLDSLMNRYIAQRSETNLAGGLNININVEKKYKDGKEN